MCKLEGYFSLVYEKLVQGSHCQQGQNINFENTKKTIFRPKYDTIRLLTLERAAVSNYTQLSRELIRDTYTRKKTDENSD